MRESIYGQSKRSKNHRSGKHEQRILHDIAFAIVKICILYRRTLNVCWLPRNENIVADFFSKLYDPDDWEIDQRIFTLFNRMGGPFTCDFFASYHNHKVKKSFIQNLWTVLQQV